MEKEPNYIFRGGLVLLLVWLITLILGGAGALFIKSEFNPFVDLLVIFHTITVFGIGMMGMTGTPPSFAEIATGSVIVLAVELGMYIFLGFILGFIYEEIKRNTKIKSLGKWLIIFVFMMPLFIILSVFSFERPNHGKIAANDGCDAFYTNFKVFFNRDYCYMNEAYKKEDTSFCSKIEGESITNENDEGVFSGGKVINKNQCYVEMAQFKEGIDICNLVSSDQRQSCIDKVNKIKEHCATWYDYWLSLSDLDREQGLSTAGYDGCLAVRQRDWTSSSLGYPSQ